MTGERASFARYRELMDRHGFRPSRRFGQNFLLDPTLHRAIADAAGITRDDVVLEVGAGLGFMTRELAERAGRVVAAEIDERLVAILRREFAAELEAGRVVLVPGDVLDAGTLAPAIVAALTTAQRTVAGGAVGDAARPDGGGRLLVVANLPYAISGPFLAGLVGAPLPLPERLVLLVQREFAERVAAPVGTAERGAPSVLAQTFFDVRVARRVGAEVFRPRPRVESAVLVAERRPDARGTAADGPWRAGYAAFVRELFAQRRKTLRHGFLRATGRELADADAALAGLRAEELDAERIVGLFDSSRTDG